jgi:vitamin B12 transporter
MFCNKTAARFLVSLIVVLAVSIFSYAADVDLDRIVVTPTRSEESITGTTSAVTVFNANSIEEGKIQGEDIKDLIVNSPGVDIVQSGSFGGPVSIFTRGTNSGQTQIMIDGVRIYDPMATNGAFDLAHLTLDNLGRIEMVSGPQSVLYGSDAMGGVINIITKKGFGKPEVSFLSSGGTYGSYREALESSGRIKDLSYSFGVSRFDTQGFSKLKKFSGNDPYGNTSVSVRADYDFNAQNTVGLIGRFTDAKFHYDSEFKLSHDPDLIGKEKQIFVSNYIENKLNDYWKQKLQLSYMGNYRRDADDKSPENPDDYLRDWYKGENYQLDWQHTIKPAKFDSIVAGIDYQRETGSYYRYSESLYGSSETNFPEKTTNTKGYYLQNLLNIDEVFHFNTGIRFDDHSGFGLHETYKVDASYIFKTGTKIKGGWGTAFKAPTIYQLYAIADPINYFGGGNPGLEPEKSATYEIGVEQDIFNGMVNFGVTYFHTNTKNLIDAVYHPDTWITDQYTNIGKARVFGYESVLSARPIEEFKFELGYTWQKTENLDTKDELLRRPKNKCYFKIQYFPIDKLDLGLKFNYVGKRKDSGNVALKAYTRVGLDANYKLNTSVEIFASADNLFDETYEELKGYNEPGRAFMGGVKLTF